MFQKFLVFVCGFAEMAAIASILTLRLSGVLAWVMLLLPLVLLVWVLVQLGRKARWERERQVQMYVPPQQRAFRGQATRRRAVPDASWELEQQYQQGRYGPLEGDRW